MPHGRSKCTDFTEYVNVFLPSSKVSADVAHRTFAGAQHSTQPAASSRPQPSEPDTEASSHGASDTPEYFQELSQKAELCSVPSLCPGSGSDVTSAGWVCGSSSLVSGSGREVANHKLLACLPALTSHWVKKHKFFFSITVWFLLVCKYSWHWKFLSLWQGFIIVALTTVLRCSSSIALVTPPPRNPSVININDPQPSSHPCLMISTSSPPFTAISEH